MACPDLCSLRLSANPRLLVIRSDRDRLISEINSLHGALTGTIVFDLSQRSSFTTREAPPRFDFWPKWPPPPPYRGFRKVLIDSLAPWRPTPQGPAWTSPDPLPASVVPELPFLSWELEVHSFSRLLVITPSYCSMAGTTLQFRRFVQFNGARLILPYPESTRGMPLPAVP